MPAHAGLEIRPETWAVAMIVEQNRTFSYTCEVQSFLKFH